MNHTNFEQRLDFVRHTIQQQYGLDTATIDPIEYDPHCMFPYNNFVYRVELYRSQSPSLKRENLPDAPLAQPGTTSIPESTQYVVMRLSNAAAGLNDKNRVQNEVAAMSLVRKALFPRRIVPAVYGWANAATDQGWILMEHMRGTPLDAEFEGMGLDDKNKTVRVIAEIFSTIQQYKLPESVRGFGGLDFDGEGNIVSAPLTISSCGPFSTYPMLVQGILREQLAATDVSPILCGWTANGTRAKLERFINDDVDRMLANRNTERKTLVHGDFTMNNFLFDGETSQITAILDFDWARVGGPADEMLHSFHKRYARLPSPYEQNPEFVSFRHALLHGFPIDLPLPTRTVRWDLAEMWDRQLAAAGANRPSTLEGIHTLSLLYTFLDTIRPETLCNEVIIKQRNEASIKEEKVATELLLERLMNENQA